METAADVKVIEVLGPGCPRCHETFRVVRHVVDSAHIECRVQKVEDMARMVELGVLRTPAVAFDGRIVCAGRIPKTEEVRKLLGLE